MTYHQDEPERGTGRTSKQIREAPADAVFVWCNDHLAYPINLAMHIGRINLKIIGPRDLENVRLDGRRAIVIDHAARLTLRQRDIVHGWTAGR